MWSLTTVLVMPSLVETVGLPMLEAASVWVPVAVADRPYGHDVCGDSALYHDPHDPLALAIDLKRLLTEETLRRQLRMRGLELADERARLRPYARMIEAVVALVGGGEGT